MRARAFYTYAALALIGGAALHVVGLLMGPDAIAFLGAPDDVVQSVADGTVYGAAITLAIALLLLGLAILSWGRRTSKFDSRIVSFILWLFAIIFAIRGMLIVFFIPPLVRGDLGESPQMFIFHTIATVFVLSIGIALAVALRKERAT